MSRVLPFRRRLKPRYVSLVLAVLAAVVIGFVATWTITAWQSEGVGGDHNTLVHTTNRAPTSGPIEVIDGDTVRFDGAVYRLVGFDTPERGDRARCDDESRRSEAATARLRTLVAGDVSLKRVTCACRKGLEGTRECNYGRLCGSLSIAGRDVGHILIGEGLARSYVCGATSCPPRKPWC